MHPVVHVPSLLSVWSEGQEEQLFMEVQVAQLGEQVRQYGFYSTVIYALYVPSGQG